MSRFTIQPRGISYHATLMPCGGRSLTIPGQAIEIGLAVKRFSAPTIQERLKGYYEQEGLELPNFDRLSKIERLDLLAESREKLAISKAKAQESIEAYTKLKAEQEEAANSSNPIPNASTDKK